MPKVMKNERDVKAAVKEVLHRYAPHVWYFMPVQGGFGAQGIPDFICCIQGIFLGIETKFAKNGLSPWQIKQMEDIRAAKGGHMIITEHNVAMVEEHIRAILALEGKHVQD